MPRLVQAAYYMTKQVWPNSISLATYLGSKDLLGIVLFGQQLSPIESGGTYQFRLGFAVLDLSGQSLLFGIGRSMPVFEAIGSDHTEDGLADCSSVKVQRSSQQELTGLFCVESRLDAGQEIDIPWGSLVLEPSTV